SATRTRTYWPTTCSPSELMMAMSLRMRPWIGSATTEAIGMASPRKDIGPIGRIGTKRQIGSRRRLKLGPRPICPIGPIRPIGPIGALNRVRRSQPRAETQVRPVQGEDAGDQHHQEATHRQDARRRLLARRQRRADLVDARAEVRQRPLLLLQF